MHGDSIEEISGEVESADGGERLEQSERAGEGRAEASARSASGEMRGGGEGCLLPCAWRARDRQNRAPRCVDAYTTNIIVVEISLLDLYLNFDN